MYVFFANILKCFFQIAECANRNFRQFFVDAWLQPYRNLAMIFFAIIISEDGLETFHQGLLVVVEES